MSVDLPQEIALVRAELGRADNKAAVLLGLAGTAVSVAVATVALVAHRLPIPARVALGLGLILMTAAVAQLLLAVRPALPQPGEGVGWTAWAGAKLPIVSTLGCEQQAAEMAGMSRLAYRKHLYIRRAVDLMIATLAVLDLIGLLALVSP